jgi:ribonucleoside-triphosphate reductase (thioredoxin)
VFVDVDRYGAFRLPAETLREARERPPPWGRGALSWITFRRSYSREGEAWWETCRRVVEGTYTVQRAHCLAHGLPFAEARAARRAAEAFRRLWDLRWTPSGRGLWIMGTPFLYARGGAALHSCGFVSSADLARDYAEPFVWLFQMAMLGVGVGFDVRGAGRATVHAPARGGDVHTVDDSREGWAAALRRLLDPYGGQGALPARFDLSWLRPAGAPLRGFGGVASGPEPLRAMLEGLEALHEKAVGRSVDAELIVDAMNLIGRCVVAGGIRRAAQLALGEPDDACFLDLKRAGHAAQAPRWVANHSVLARVGMDYTSVARLSAARGEPGYLWLDNARAFGRMGDPADHADHGALGTNPCAEQTLWDRELCCLVETYPARHDDLDDYLVTLDLAHEYAKTVTLVPTHDARTNEILARNRRVGCSMTGVVQAIERHGYRRFLRWCDTAYTRLRQLDAALSERLRVPRSIKLSSVKPSGTVSLLAGATPGVHWEHAPYYLRRVRLAASDPLAEACREAGYAVEEDVAAPATLVVGFPVHVPHLPRAKHEVSLWEKVDLAAQMQRYWSDNQVSCTAEFDPERERDELPRVLEAYEDRLKALVFLPAERHGYAQPPFEAIDREEYARRTAALRPLRADLAHVHALEERFCDGATCEIP